MTQPTDRFPLAERRLWLEAYIRESARAREEKGASKAFMDGWRAATRTITGLFVGVASTLDPQRTHN